MKTSPETKSDSATDTWGTTPGPWLLEISEDDGFSERDKRAIDALPAMIKFIEELIQDADAGQLVGQAREAEARAIKRRVTGG